MALDVRRRRQIEEMTLSNNRLYPILNRYSDGFVRGTSSLGDIFAIQTMHPTKQ